MKLLETPGTPASVRGSVYCPICTHTVEADILFVKKAAKVKPGQKCSRCHASLDAGYVLRLPQAA